LSHFVAFRFPMPLLSLCVYNGFTISRFLNGRGKGATNVKGVHSPFDGLGLAVSTSCLLPLCSGCGNGRNHMPTPSSVSTRTWSACLANMRPQVQTPVLPKQNQTNTKKPCFLGSKPESILSHLCDILAM
jgi:hypothetical protein